MSLTKANNRMIDGAMTNVKDFGAKGDGATDDTAAIQAAIDSLAGVGGMVYFPAGDYVVSSQITVSTATNTGEPSESASYGNDFTLFISLCGDGAGASRLFGTHAGTILKLEGGNSAGWHTHVSVTKLGVGKRISSGLRTAGSKALEIYNMAMVTISECDFTYCEYGVYAQDWLSSTMENCTIRLNKYGLYAAKDLRTHPNNLAFNHVSVINNTKWGYHFIRPHLCTFYGGSVESNGLVASGDSVLEDAGSWGIKAENSGTEGVVGLVCNGMYLEGNNGTADVWIVQDTAAIATARAVHSFHACSFLRFKSTDYTTRNIRVDSNNTDSTIAVSHCGFKAFAPYVDSGARRFLDGIAGTFSDGGGNLYRDTAGGTIGLDTTLFKASTSGYGGLYVGGKTSANIMRMYEQGTFTPRLEIGGSDVGITYPAGGQAGSYTRIGDRVFFDIFVTITSKGGLTGKVTINDLPYPVGDYQIGTSVESSGTIGYFDFMTTPVYSIWGIVKTPEVIDLHKSVAAVTTPALLDGADISDTWTFRMSGSYTV